MIQLKEFIVALLLCLSPYALAGQELPINAAELCRAALEGDAQWSEPLAMRFDDAQKQVSTLLERYGRAMHMGYLKRQALMDLVLHPEHRQYFNHALSKTLFNVEPSALTAGHVTEKLFDIFITAELARLGPRTFRAHLRTVSDGLIGLSHRAYNFIKGNVSGVVVGGIIVAFISPAWQQPLNEFQSVLYRIMPDFMRPAELVDHDGTDEAVAPPHEVADFYTRIWRQANEGVPMNQREGRSYYYEADTLLLILDGNARTLMLTEPESSASAEDRALWRASLLDVRAAIVDQPGLFPDVYHTDYARAHIEPRRLRILSMIDRALTE